MADPQQRLQAFSDEYQKLQQDLQNNIDSRQKLESQQQENKGVQKEFAELEDDANIYKLVGPVLLKQDKTEVVMAVDARLDFIDKEIKRVEKLIKDVQDKSDALRAQIIKIRSEAEQHGAQALA